MRTLIAILIATSLCGCSPSSPAAPPSVADIAAGYTKLRLMTQKPVYVPPAHAMACTYALQEHVEAMRLTHGPHAQTLIQIYMNDLASNAFERQTLPYPVGSVIVKEKQALQYRKTQPDLENHNNPEYMIETNGVGGMVKRQPGYDPQHGDWEYFYFEVPTQIESGRIESCVQCHLGAAKTDYVFGDWVIGSEAR